MSFRFRAVGFLCVIGLYTSALKAQWEYAGEINTVDASSLLPITAGVEVGFVRPNRSLIGVSNLGQGKFGVSRVGQGAAQVPLMVVATGYKPQLVWANLKQDCQSTEVNCNKNVQTFYLEKRTVYVNQIDFEKRPDTLFMARKETWNKASGVATVRRALQMGRIDAKTADDLESFSPDESMGKTFVVVAPASKELSKLTLQNTIKKIVAVPGGMGEIAPIFGGIIGWLAATNPQIAAALIAAKAILGYLKPILDQINPQWGSIAQFILDLLGGGAGDGQMQQLAHAVYEKNPDALNTNTRIYASYVDKTVTSDTSIQKTVADLRARSLQSVLSAKQVFASQLIDAWSDRHVKSLFVEQDIRNVRAVEVTGTVRDMIRLLELPNVESLISSTVR